MLHHLRRLRVDVQHLNFEHSLGALSNLPFVEEVTVVVKCVKWRERNEFSTWVYDIYSVVCTDEQVRVRQLTHSEWGYELFVGATYWEGFGSKDAQVSFATHMQFGLACKVCVYGGKILEVDAEEGTREE